MNNIDKGSRVPPGKADPAEEETSIDRELTEETLRQKGDFLGRLIELSPVVLVVYDLVTGHHTYFSADALQVYGYTGDEMAQMRDPFAVLLQPEDIPRVQENVEKLKRLGDGEINDFECRVRRGDGELRWINARSMVFERDEEGKPRQIISATYDITERREAEEKLIESEKRFRSYFELGLIGMAVTSPTKGCLAVNHELCRILGYERDELLRRNWAEITHPDDLAADVAYFDRVMAGELDGYRLDKRWIRKDGHVIDTTIAVKCVRGEDDAVDYFVALVDDVTERKQLEDDNRRAEEALRQANEDLEHRVLKRTEQLSRLNENLRNEIVERERVEAERERLLRRSVSAQEDERRRIAREMHDQLGQTLSVLALKLSALRDDHKEQPELRDEIASLKKIVRQLDADVGHLVHELRPTALDDFGLGVALSNYVRNWSQQFGVRAELHMSGMEKERLSSEVETAVYRITQEALTNIAKHANAKNVDIILERRSDYVSLIAEDDGAGFEVEQELRADGKGFGLISMRERAALVSGTLAVESKLGVGATVAVRIPASHRPRGEIQNG